MLRMQELFLFYGWLMFSSTKTEKEAQHSFQKNENMALLLYLTYGRKTQPANSSEINSNRYFVVYCFCCLNTCKKKNKLHLQSSCLSCFRSQPRSQSLFPYLGQGGEIYRNFSFVSLSLAETYTLKVFLRSLS